MLHNLTQTVFQNFKLNFCEKSIEKINFKIVLLVKVHYIF